MVEIGFVGTGGSVATPERDNTSLAIRLGSRLVLVDCPGSVLAKIRKLGYDPLSLDSILVTHIHPDHIYGLPALIHSLMLEEGKIRLYGSEQTAAFCASLLDLFGLREKKIKMRVEILVLKAGDRFPSLIPLHTSALALGCLAEDAQVGCLIPCHFFGELDFALSEIEEEIRQNYTGRLVIPRDFDKIVL